MKRLLFVCALWGLAGLLMAAAPANNSAYDGGIEGTTGATVDSQWTGDWELLDSLILIATDTCNMLTIATGTAAMDPGDKLYVGILSGGGDFEAAPSDTLILEWPACMTYSTSLTFHISYTNTLRSQTDANDTVYVTAAVQGSTHAEEVTITGFSMSAVVADYDAP